MRDRNAKVIVPFALAVWLAGIFVFQDGTPELLRVFFVVAFAVSVPIIVFSLMAGTGWSTLAARYRATEHHGGPWRRYPTAVMSLVSIEDPAFRAEQMRFLGGTLSVATSPEALHLSMLFAKVPLLGSRFPEIRIPWSAVSTARTYAAPGWYAPQRQPGTILQAAYDPNYRGMFVEIGVGDPVVYLQLPTDLLGSDAMSRLPVRP